VAPSLVPRKPGDRIKTNRRDALTLARLPRAGELTAVWIPDPTHEAMRDLVRARTAAMEAVRRARQQLQGFLLRHGRVFTGRKAWSSAHRRWLAGLRFEHPAQQIVLQEQIDVVEEAERRRDRLGEQIRVLARTGRWRRWSPPCRRCAASRSCRRWCWPPRSATSAASPPSPADGLARPGPLGALQRRQGRARRDHQGRQRPGAAGAGRGGLELPLPGPGDGRSQARLEGVPEAARAIAWKAQLRLCARYRA
jgi:hypothetical protein